MKLVENKLKIYRNLLKLSVSNNYNIDDEQ